MPIDPQVRSRYEFRLRQVRVATVIGFVIFALLLISGIAAFAFEARFVVNSDHELGQVTQVAPNDDSDRVTYTFQDAYGRVQNGSSSCRHGAYHVGDSVNLLCEMPARTSNKPVRSEMTGFMNQWGLAVILFALGALNLMAAMRLRSYYKMMRKRLDAALASDGP